MPFRAENRHLTIPLVLIVGSLIVTGIGAQAYLAQEDNADRDRRDAAYADCLTDFATELVGKLDDRTTASARLERAQVRLDAAERAKDAATDRVFDVVILARRTPPEANERDFDRALAARQDAQRRYADALDHRDDVKEQVEQVREENPYTPPSVSCSR